MKNEILTLGAVAYAPKAVTIWEGLKEYFIQENCELDYILFSNYETQVEALFAGTIDIAWNTNIAYVKTDLRLNGQARVIAMRDTDLEFTTKIVVRSNSGITALKELRAKLVAFGSCDSAQAAIIPEYYLKREGLAAGRDYEALRFNSDLGKHGDTGRSELDVVEAVVSGKAAAGAIGETTWSQLMAADADPQLISIWTSPPYSHCNFTALPTLAHDRVKHFSEALVKMDFNNPDQRKILELEGLRKWISGSKAGYKAVFEAVVATGYLPKENMAWCGQVP